MCCLLSQIKLYSHRVRMMSICSSLCCSSLLPSLGRVCSGNAPDLHFFGSKCAFPPSLQQSHSSLTTSRGTGSAEPSTELWLPRPGHCPSQPVPELNTARQTNPNSHILEPVWSLSWWLWPVHLSSQSFPVAAPLPCCLIVSLVWLRNGLCPCVSLQ